MFPLYCDSVTSKKLPYATIALILACGAAFVRHDLLDPYVGIFVPVNLSYAVFHPMQEGPAVVASLIAAFFLHAGWLHLLSNMWFLWVFGWAMELHLGAVRFLTAYLVCGVVSMVAQSVSAPLSGVPIVGASGAIAGIMGLHFIMLPVSRIMTYVPPVFILRIPAFVFLGFWLLIQYVNVRTGDGTSGGVAWWAHIGGYLAGTGCGIYMRLTKGAKRRA